ncbi:3-oxoacyl-ACP synthase [Croceitalea rosinachiae]|uniref:3-oxoacyl-ACP synthase n=1 Tax=Croceitalea rosinachiae TaxID=3075596 RepID=A0ABU3A8T8_9FLAO|nr:3-oxoacyl-ACP synthase [Croceitalea sp. F388]MDT0606374.1 3-oxoacyl-ACP synthase [Croceitalea sp. F388]
MKTEAYQYCKAYVNSRIQRIQKQINEVKLSLSSESKSTAGDKHETGRAMLQLEREKLGQQLLEAEKMQQLLKKVPTETNSERVVLGSLVQTDTTFYYIAISAGKYEAKAAEIFCISPNTPIARLLLGKEVDHNFEFNKLKSKIIAIS